MTALRTLLDDHPKETELHERVRLYLNVCERHLHDRETPKTLGERIYAATLAINGGMFDEAERLLSRVLDEAPDHDHAYFMLAIARTGRGATDGALQALCEAVRLNPENRAVARHDPDLVLLRPLPEFQRLVNGHSPRRFDGPPRS